MSMGQREGESQGELWIPTGVLAGSPGHPFYERLNEILRAADFDAHVEDLCQPFYKEGGRPSIRPGVYFRMLMVGYFEGLDSERGIAWRCGDSLALRAFLGIGLDESVSTRRSPTTSATATTKPCSKRGPMSVSS